MKKLLLVPAFIMGLAMVSFAGNPKGETKDAKAETPTEVNTTSGDGYYWFPTNAAGTALTDPSGIPLSQGTAEVGPCTGSGDYCARGFLLSETTISNGKRVPIIDVADGEPSQED